LCDHWPAPCCRPLEQAERIRRATAATIDPAPYGWRAQRCDDLVEPVTDFARKAMRYLAEHAPNVPVLDVLAFMGSARTTATRWAATYPAWALR
jgi:hypothetical protein